MNKILLVFLFTACCAAQQINFTYTLPVDATNVSIGVKDFTGAVIRTLWTGRKNAGTYTGIWDGNDDIGRTATNGPFTIAVLYGNPTYHWDGLIGNTSNRMYGYERWNPNNQFIAQQRMTFVNGMDWITQGGSEGTVALSYIRDSEPNTPHIIMPSFYYQAIQLVDIANDGQYLYAISNSPWTSAP